MSTLRQLYDLAGADPGLRFSPYCWRSRYALAHKRLEVDTLPWRMHEGARLAFSGQGRVPVLVDGGRSIHDSWAIALYLEEAYPDAPALFDGPGAVAVTRFINVWADHYLHGLISPLIVLAVHDALDPRDQAYFRTSREQRFGMTLEAYTAGRAAHLSAFRRALEPVRALLGTQPWLSGTAPAYADYILAGTLQWPRAFIGGELLAAGDPVAGWLGRVLDLHDGLGRNARLAAGVGD